MRIHKDSAYYGITKYSDLSPDEFRKIGYLISFFIKTIFNVILYYISFKKSKGIISKT